MNILILGGGISGLSAAWHLRKKFPGAKITLLEKTNRLGGWIDTEERGGFLFEKGPRTFMASHSESLLSLIEEVGLRDEIVFSADSSAARYLWHKEKLRSMGSFLPRLLPALLREPFIPAKISEEESIYDFAVRRFNPRIAETLFDPMALGIYGGDIRKLSVRSCFPFMPEWEEKHGSVVRGMFARRKKKSPRGLFTLKRGMKSLIEEIQKKLAVEFAVDCPVEAISQEGVVARGKTWKGDWIVSALSGPEIGRLTGLWSEFPAASMWVVNIGFSENALTKKGFGYLVPSQEKEPLLGMIWDSSIFPVRRNETRLTAMVRHSKDKAGDETGAREVALQSLKRHLKIETIPDIIEARLAYEAIPQFEVGYAKRLARFQSELKEALPHFSLIGNYVEGASVDACIRAASRL